METLLLDTLRQEVETLRQELDIVEQRAAALHNTLERTVARISELAAEAEEAQAHTAPCPREAEEPEIEVELIVCDDEEEPFEHTEVTEEEAPAEEPVAEDMPTPLQAEAETEAEAAAEEEEEEKEAMPAPQPARTASPLPCNGTTLLPPVDDIRKAISLGDRFLFQRELFGGDGEKMNKTIDTLNKQHSLEEAMQFIGKKFTWDKETTAYELFTSILKRRFS